MPNTIGIVTISFNQGQFIEQCLQTVGEELVTGDQHCVMDAVSVDGSRDLIARYASSNPQLLYSVEKDRGPADGLNKGFSRLKSDIYAYINADDFPLRGTGVFVRDFFEKHSDIDVLIGAVKIADESGALSLRGRVPDKITTKRLECNVFQYYQQGTYFRRRCFETTDGFNVKNRTCWDREFIIDLLLNGARCAVTSKPLGAFRIHGQSITGKGDNYLRYKEDLERIQEKIGARMPKSVTRLERRLFALEGRLNPIRWLLQFRQ